MDYSVFLGLDLWWLYELTFFFLYFMHKFTSHWNKDRHVILQPDGRGGWSQIGEYWVSRTAKWFRSKSKKSFTTEPEASAFNSLDLSGSHRTILHHADKARPRDVILNDEEAAKSPTSIKVKIEPKKQGLDPTSQALDTFLAEKAWQQTLRANASAHPEVVMLLLVAGVAAMAGLLLGMFAFPQHVYVPVPSPTGAAG